MSGENMPGSDSRLLNLPAEIRNRIWELALHQEEGVHPVGEYKYDEENGLSLLDTNKQIRGEARELFYTGNAFHFKFTREEVVKGIPETTDLLYRIGIERICRVAAIHIEVMCYFKFELAPAIIQGKSCLQLKYLWVRKDKPKKRDDQTTSVARPVLKNKDHIRASINFALRQLFHNPETDLASYCGYRLIVGLSQYLLWICEKKGTWESGPVDHAIDFITGTAKLSRAIPTWDPIELVSLKTQWAIEAHHQSEREKAGEVAAVASNVPVRDAKDLPTPAGGPSLSEGTRAVTRPGEVEIPSLSLPSPVISDRHYPWFEEPSRCFVQGPDGGQ